MVINYKSKDFIGQTRYTTRYIRDLKELYNEGTLSKEEFIKAKEKILK